jgi:hypothetical protein
VVCRAALTRCSVLVGAQAVSVVAQQAPPLPLTLRERGREGLAGHNASLSKGGDVPPNDPSGGYAGSLHTSSTDLRRSPNRSVAPVAGSVPR